MKKISFYIILISLTFVSNSLAAISFDADGAWGTSFLTCSDADICSDTSPACIDGARSNNVPCNTSAASCSPGTSSMMLAAANYSGGAGGAGWRQYFTNQTAVLSDGINLAGGVYVPAGNKELWFRYYGRYSSSFTTGWLKQIWTLDAGNSVGRIDWRINLASDFSDLEIGGAGTRTASSIGLQSIIGGSTWDGQWHCFEVYWKRGNGDGVWRVWVDGQPLVNQTGIVTDTHGTYGEAHGGLWINISQQVGGTGCGYNDFDDIKVVYNPANPDLVMDTNGNKMIGPLTGGSTDSSAPIIGTTSPSGAQTCTDVGGNTTRIQALVTDATSPINCEYSTSSGFSFGAGTAMLPTNGGSGANFYADIANACNASYTYYMKCQDSAGGGPYTSGNSTFSYSIDAFAVDSTDPTIGSVGPSGEQTCIYDPRDMTVYAYTVADDVEIDYVKISTSSGFDPTATGSSMTDEGNGTWSYTFSGGSQLACDASYTYYAKAVDTSGNISAQSTISFSIAAQGSANLLMYEGFEDNSFSSRGWYDGANPTGVIDADGQSGNCIKFTFDPTDKTANGMDTSALRHLLTDTDKLYVKAYIKPALDWVGSHHTYHPHVIYLMSNQDGNYDGFYGTHLTTYFEWGNDYNGLTPQFMVQDGANVNLSYGSVPNDIVSTTENRAISYCNGYVTGQDTGDIRSCFLISGSDYGSETVWVSGTEMNRDAWNLLEAYYEMNSTPGGVAIPDGKLYVWLNDTLVVQKDHMVYRSGTYPSLAWHQLGLSPYIGDGSPVTQTIYMDELYVYDNLLRDSPAPPANLDVYKTRAASGNSAVRPSGNDLSWGSTE